jgi:hypothetical protein
LKDRAQVYRLFGFGAAVLGVNALGVNGLSEEAGDRVVVFFLCNLQAERRVDAREGVDVSLASPAVQSGTIAASFLNAPQRT